MKVYSRQVAAEPVEGIDYASSIIATFVRSQLTFMCEPLEGGSIIEFTVPEMNAKTLDAMIKYLSSVHYDEVPQP